jgi:hypothetical protein
MFTTVLLGTLLLTATPHTPTTAAATVPAGYATTGGREARPKAPPAPASGSLRVRIFDSGVPAFGLAEVFRTSGGASIANTGDGGVLTLDAGAYRVKVRRNTTVKWYDVTVVADATVAVTAVF